jgi:dTDP-4-dehydrorhamnose reductase
MNRSILVIGANGQLGKRLVRRFSPQFEVQGLDLPEVDITDRESVEAAIAKSEPQVLLNAAAFTAVDRCEEEPDLAFRVNAEGPGNLAEAAKACGALLVHFSTDFVFDGKREGPPYTEEDKTNPLSVYGKSKLAGEDKVLNSGAEALVLRLAWLYGMGAWNFVDWVIDAVKKNERPRIVTDQMGSPTWVGDVADQVDRLIERQKRGLYHCVGKGSCSRYEWACLAVRAAGLDPAAIEPISSNHFAQKAPRPKYSALDNKRLRDEGVEAMRPWEEALHSHLRESRPS